MRKVVCILYIVESAGPDEFYSVVMAYVRAVAHAVGEEMIVNLPESRPKSNSWSNRLTASGTVWNNWKAPQVQILHNQAARVAP